MAEWDWTDPDDPVGGAIHIVITLEQYNMDVGLWAAAVRLAKIQFPPDPPD